MSRSRDEGGDRQPCKDSRAESLWIKHGKGNDGHRNRAEGEGEMADRVEGLRQLGVVEEEGTTEYAHKRGRRRRQ